MVKSQEKEKEVEIVNVEETEKIQRQNQDKETLRMVAKMKEIREKRQQQQLQQNFEKQKSSLKELLHKVQTETDDYKDQSLFKKSMKKSKMVNLQILVVERGYQEAIRVYYATELKWLSDEVLFALEKMKILHQSKDKEEVDFCYKCIREFAEMRRR
ncbi:hypothetical protein L1987_21422 [Smallanthus sonchifolius]|uniref:Uncharacterized protein n=1 Tax=Smallanthus sonchifolius TaxID=185202 RepID=A0ACB9IUJ8_9ASTR|nr:hypothetical protein L1987_21422 [Smallanthus sonchifolius]